MIARSLSSVEFSVGNLRAGLEAAQERMETARGRPPESGNLIPAMAMLARSYVRNGERDRAEEILEEMHRNLDRVPGSTRAVWRNYLEGLAAAEEARLAGAAGNHEHTIELFVQAIDATRALIKSRGGFTARNASLERRLTGLQLNHSRSLRRVGRVVDAELVDREILLRNLQRAGKYSPRTARAVTNLSITIFSQGRFAESEALSRAAVDILSALGAPQNGSSILRARLSVANALSGHKKWKEAAAIIGEIERSVGGDRIMRARTLGSSLEPALTYFRVGDIEAGLALATDVFNRRSEQFGVGHYLTAEARGFLGLGNFLNGDPESALADFRVAVPVLIADARQADSGSIAVSAREILRRAILDGYISLLAQIHANPSLAEPGFEAAAEAFWISDVGRGSSVQRSVTQSSARAAARDPELAAIVRQEQDLLHEISALFELLTDLLSIPQNERDSALVENLREEIDDLRVQRAEARKQLEERFPDYVRLIDPSSPRLEEVREVIADDEAVVVTYVTDDDTYVWSFGKSGEIGFISTEMGRQRVNAVANQLRRALDPNARTLAEIPDFDAELAHRLYQTLLEPVAAIWREVPHLVVVSDGPLGQIPFSLLPTATPGPGTDEAVVFDRYRKVTWLARSHSVTVMPSMASLVALRALPVSATAERPFVGFGDPVFTQEQLAQTPLPGGTDTLVNRGGISMRNIPVRLRSLPETRDVDSSEFSRLPRLPDTADEIRTIAAVMQADPARDVFLGVAASEPSVRKAPLKDYRVVAFATHGLVPGDLNGLVQPALAMTAPGIAGDKDGDGLLTMGEIFELEMNADWVVLSACNTGTGGGAGAEAVSGLGRAFFYAGTRALLVSNWPVETTSARILTTDIFARQSADSGLARAEALRLAQVALIDGPGFIDSETGEPAFSYAHPIFWAPFSLIGEGGLIGTDDG